MLRLNSFNDTIIEALGSPNLLTLRIKNYDHGVDAVQGIVSTSIRIVLGLLKPNAAKKFYYQGPHYLVEKYFGSVVIGGGNDRC